MFKGLVNFHGSGDTELQRMYNDLKERIKKKQESCFCRDNQNDDGLNSQSMKVIFEKSLKVLTLLTLGDNCLHASTFLCVGKLV